MTTEATTSNQEPDLPAGPVLTLPPGLLPTAAEDEELGRWQVWRRDAIPLLAQLTRPQWLSVVAPGLVLLVYTLVQARSDWFYWGSPLIIQAFVPVLAIWLAWRFRREIMRQYYELAFVFTEDSPKRRGKIWAVPIGCLLMMLSGLVEIRAGIVVGFVITLIGAVYYLFGPFVLRTLWRPLAFLLLVIPIPPEFLARLGIVLQRGQAFLASFLARQWDKSAELRDRVIVHTSSHDIVVGPILNGMNVIFPVFVLTIWLAVLRRIPVLTSIALVAIGFVLSVLSNTLRILALAYWLGQSPGLPQLELTTWLQVAVTFAAVVLIAGRLTAPRKIEEEEAEEDDAEADLEKLLRDAESGGAPVAEGDSSDKTLTKSQEMEG